MKRALTPYHLGGTLYLPASHKKLSQTLQNPSIEGLKSVIVDFEDAIDETAFEKAHETFVQLIKEPLAEALIIFVRPRSIAHLHQLLSEDAIEKLDGFVLAKCDTKTMKPYFKALKNRDFWVMPVLESIEVFDPKKLKKIAAYFDKKRAQILSLRFGAEDLSSHLGLKRSCEETLYDLPALVYTLSQLITTFKPLGFQISAPVYSCYKNIEGLKQKVSQDLQAGFIGKTVIHPDQVAAVNDLLKVSASQLLQAQKVSEKDAQSIIAQEGVMLETAPHRRWAKGIIARAGLYGVA